MDTSYGANETTIIMEEETRRMEKFDGIAHTMVLVLHEDYSSKVLGFCFCGGLFFGNQVNVQSLQHEVNALV
jgi:hypothetical protein